MISSETGMDPFFRDIIKTRFPLAHEEGKSKVRPLAETIRRNVEDGMSIHFLGLHYRSHAAIYELGFLGFSPRPGEPFLFNLSNIPTCKELDGILTILGMMMPNPKTNCLGALSAAQVDKFGNLNTTVLPERRMLITGSGGAHDVMSAAREVVVIMPQSRERFVEKVSYITSPGAAARTLVSTLGVFEKLGDDHEFTLTAYFEDQLPKEKNVAIRTIREQCGWDLRVIDNPKKFPIPDGKDLATLRIFDPDRYFLRD